MGESKELDCVSYRGFVNVSHIAGVGLRGFLAAAPPPTVLALARSGNTLGGRVAGFSSLMLVVLCVSL